MSIPVIYWSQLICLDFLIWQNLAWITYRIHCVYTPRAILVLIHLNSPAHSHSFTLLACCVYLLLVRNMSLMAAVLLPILFCQNLENLLSLLMFISLLATLVLLCPFHSFLKQTSCYSPPGYSLYLHLHLTFLLILTLSPSIRILYITTLLLIPYMRKLVFKTNKRAHWMTDPKQCILEGIAALSFTHL